MIECIVEEIADDIKELLKRKLTQEEISKYCEECHAFYGYCRIKG